MEKLRKEIGPDSRKGVLNFRIIRYYALFVDSIFDTTPAGSATCVRK